MTSYSNTRLSTYRQCRLKYHWQYVDKYGPQSDSLALRRGRAAHKAMASFYEGKSIKEAVADAWEEYDPFDEETTKGMSNLDFLLTRYFNWCRSQDLWRVLAVEKTVEVKYGKYKLMGIWDLLVNKGGKIFIVDHKFQKSHQMSHLEVDSQVTHYLALARLLNIDVHGLIYNIVNLEMGNTETISLRQVAGRKDRFIDAYLESLDPQIKEMKKADRGKLPIYPNWTKDCCWMCQFYRRCVDTPYKIG